MIEPGRMEDYGKQLGDLLMQGNVQQERVAATITIPGDHPKADTLRRLLRELAYETLVEPAPGAATELTQGLYKPGAEDKVKQCVRDIVGPEGFDQLMAQIDQAAEHMDRVAGGRAAMKGLQDPKKIGGMVRLAAEMGLFNEFPQHDIIRMANKAVEQELTGREILDHHTSEGAA